MSDYRVVNGIAMKPGTSICVSDRDDPNYDHEGTIVSVNSDVYLVQFGSSRDTRREYDLDQIVPNERA